MILGQVSFCFQVFDFNRRTCIHIRFWLVGCFFFFLVFFFFQNTFGLGLLGIQLIMYFDLKIWLGLIFVGSKNSAAPTHFIQGPRPMPKRKKHPRMNKKAPSCQEISPRTILSSANRNRGKEERHALKDNLPGRPKQKGLTQWASHRSMAKEQFQEKLSPPH